MIYICKTDDVRLSLIVRVKLVLTPIHVTVLFFSSTLAGPQLDKKLKVNYVPLSMTYRCRRLTGSMEVWDHVS